MSLLGTAAAATVLAQYAQDLLGIGKQTIGDITDSSKVSLPAYTRPLRLCSRVYIDATVSSDPVVTDIVKTVHTQYAAFILSALQMNQFVTSGRTVQDILHVVATEDNKFHGGPGKETCLVKVTYILRGEDLESFGVPEGYCVMSIERVYP